MNTYTCWNNQALFWTDIREPPDTKLRSQRRQRISYPELCWTARCFCLWLWNLKCSNIVEGWKIFRICYAHQRNKTILYWYLIGNDDASQISSDVYIFKMKKIGNHQQKAHQLPFALKDLMSWAVGSFDVKKKNQGDCSPSSLQLLLYTSTYLEPTSKKQTLFNCFKKNSGHLTKDEVISFRRWKLFSRNLWKYPPGNEHIYPIKGSRLSWWFSKLTVW